MLDTILHLGHIVGGATDNLKFHAQIIRAPFDEPNVEFFQLPVRDGRFQFPRRNEDDTWEMFETTTLDNENLKSLCYCWNFKTSGDDSTKKFVFGDLCHVVTRNQAEVQKGFLGNYLLGDTSGSKGKNYSKNSFNRSLVNEDVLSFEENTLIRNFRQSFSEQIDEIEAFIKSHDRCYIHFDFGNQHWYDIPDIQGMMNAKMRETYAVSDGDGYYITKSLYKTLSGDKADAIGFTEENLKKARIFNGEEFLDLTFGSAFAEREAQRIGSIKIIILPRGEHLNSGEIEEFFDRVAPLKKVKGQPITLPLIEEESALRRDNVNENDLPGVLQMDCIFAREGQQESDLIELSGLDRSFLTRIHERINEAKERSKSLYGQYAKMSGRKGDKWFFIEKAFKELLLDHRFESHLLKTLPKVYSATYSA